jgi:hypothetical protein
LKQNSTNSTEVQVKNTGNVSQAITFTIDDITSSWWSANASSATLATANLAGFKVTFNVGNVEIKDYAGKFKATSPNKTITSSFTLRVLPSAKNETAINDTLLIYRSEILQLGATINASKAAGVNVTIVEVSFSALMSKLGQAETYAAAGDYFNAYQLLSVIKAQVESVKNELEAAKQQKSAEQGFFNLTLAIVIGIAAAGAVVAYLFWPTKSEYKPGKGYLYRGKGKEKIISERQVKTIIEKLKDFLSDIKLKLKRHNKKGEYYEYGKE